MQISAILSDYDVTLCPTASIRNKENNIIPEELENTLWDISEKIPICIVSSKDFDFLHNKTGFASVVSCLLGIETVTLRRHKRTMLSPLSSKEGIYLLISLQNVESLSVLRIVICLLTILGYSITLNCCLN